MACIKKGKAIWLSECCRSIDESPRRSQRSGAFLFPPLVQTKEKKLHEFSRDVLKMLQMFVTHKSVRIAYYTTVGVAYLFAIAQIIKAIRWW